MDSCYAGENVFLKAYNVGALRGHAAGAGGGNFVNCYSLATLDAVNDSGLLGYNWDNGANVLVISGCYNAKGAISTMADTGYYGALSNNYETATSGFNEGNTLLTAEQMQGENALNNMSTLNNYGNYYVATETYPTLSVFKGIEVKEVWNGTTSKPTQTDDKGNILINNGAELAYIIENGGAAGANYKLTADIYLNNLDKINWATGEAQSDYVPNQWYEGVAFQGNIDGNGHVVYGLYVSTDTAMATEWGYAECYGLIPLVAHGTTATVKKLGIDKAYLKAANSVGAFVGYAGSKGNKTDADYANVSIDQCYVGETVSLNAYDAGAFIGGNLRASISITNSYSLGTANDAIFANSCFIADNYKSVFAIRNCYNANGTIFGAWDKENIDVNCANNYATGYDLVKEDKGPEAMYATMLDAENMKGHDVFTDKAKMPTLNTTGKFVAEEGYPTLVAFLGYEINVDEAVWDGTTSAPTANSDGVYEIGTAEEFAYIIENGGAAGATYKLTSDIYLNSPDYISWSTGEVTRGYIPNSWYYDTFFSGNIDGDGHTVYGLYYNETGVADWRCEGVGLVPHVNSGTSVNITNLGIDNAFVHSYQGASAFVGFAGTTSNYKPEVKAQVTIDNCYAGAKVYLEGGCTGVFRACTKDSVTTITNSYTLANTTGVVFDGLVGNAWDSTTTIRNVYNANGPVATKKEASSANTIVSNVYATDNTGFAEGVAILDKNQMLGVNALDVMSGLSIDTFKAVPDYYPVLNKFAQNKLVKNNRLYYGVAINDALDFYSTASGEQYFWRYDNILVNNDSSMDVSDLVLLMLQTNAGTAKADIDGDGNSTTDDLKIFRKALIGKTDYVNNPMYSVGEYTPVTTSLSADYQFVWGDEFDGDTLDSRKWGIYAKMNGSSGEYEGDVVNSSDEKAIAVEDGNLRLTAYKTEDGKYVTPTSVVTQNTMNFKYGYVEIRAKFPVQDGIWSSWWTKSVFDKSDTDNLIQSSTKVGAEVDMIEVFDTNQATFNIIKWWEIGDDNYKDWYPNDATRAHKKEITSDRYYVFGYEWTEDDKIRMYCDGELYGEYDVSVPYTEMDKEFDDGTLIANGVNNINTDPSGTDMECFDVHQYLIFNNHLFYPTISDAGMYITENTDFTRADYLIDYCRVYQKSGASDIVTK